MSVLVDTSCLLRLSGDNDPLEAATQTAMERPVNDNAELVVAPQNFVEFRGAATRPAAVNGLGLTLAVVELELDWFSRLFALLPEDGFHPHWRDLCRRAKVSGVKTILTWNPSAFTRFIPFVPGLVVLTPDQVLAGA